MASFYQRNKEANSEALRLFYKAIGLDPNSASAYGMAAWCHTWCKINGGMVNRTQEIAEGVRLARRAVELGEKDAVALTRGGHSLGFLVGDLDSGPGFRQSGALAQSELGRGVGFQWLAELLSWRNGDRDRTLGARHAPESPRSDSLSDADRDGVRAFARRPL